MGEMMQALVNTRKQLRRGKDGRAEAVDILTADGQLIASQKVERGPDGRVVGTK